MKKRQDNKTKLANRPNYLRIVFNIKDVGPHGTYVDLGWYVDLGV